MGKNQPKILVIDDEKSLRILFRSFLTREGYEVITAKDFSSAFKQISNNPDIGIIISDIILGEFTGIDILREIRSRNIMCPVIMVTGHPTIETASEAVRLGAFDYLSKPVSKDALLRVTSLALKHKTLLDEKRQLETEKERYRVNLEAIFGSLREAVITVDHEMRVIEANKATKSICGFTQSQIKGKMFGETQGQCNKPCVAVLKETLGSRNSILEFRVECHHQEKSGQVVLLSSSPLLSKDHTFMGAVLVARDVTRLSTLEREIRERHRFHNMIGKSKKMQEVYMLLENLTDTDTTVLITGKSGTGKELVAKALHYEGLRSGKSFINVNCSVLAENLLESELFGHVKGAFTGAIRDKIGRFEMADGGTILLDEIGDISPRIQLKLLKFLQEREFERVGDPNPIKVDVRVITATNRDLKEMVRTGEFREDLYYRIKVVEIAMPPLVERRDDIPLFIDHFVALFNKKLNKDIEGVSNEVLNILMRYTWPGNIRELEHVIEHAFVLCHGRTITSDHLPMEILEYSKSKGKTQESRSITEPEEILTALGKAHWNKTKAATLLGINRRTLYRKIDKFNLVRPTQQM